MLIVSVVGGLGGVAGSLDGITLRETRAGSQLCLNSPLSSLEALGWEGSSGSFNHHEHFIFYRCWRSTKLMVCQGWSWIFIDAVMAIKCGPQWRMTWILRTKWTKPKSWHHTHTFPIAKFSQLSSHDIQSLLVAFPGPVFKFAYIGKFRWPYRSVPTYYYYYYYHFRPNQFYKMDSTSTSTSTRPSQAALVEVEVEAQPTRLGRLRLRLRLRHSLPG